MELNTKARAWVDRTLANLSLEGKVGQILVPMLTANSAAPLSITEWVERYGFGGGHLFGGTAEEIRSFVEQAQAVSETPMLMTGDLDRGGERIAEGTVFPSQMALGAADDEQLAYALGRSIAQENLAVGYNWTFSPIVDLFGHQDHQRHIASIGEDPEQVARLTCAQIRGLQDHGMAACAKHFPGDGFDDRDQHLTTTINPLSEEQWWASSGYAFQKAIDAGVWTIMNAFIACPAVDRDCDRYDPRFPLPAALSRYLTHTVLREKMGFEGVIITDALNMGGIAHHCPQPERYARAFEAGNDMLLFVNRMEQTFPFMVECFQSGRIAIERLDASVRRILTLKARLGLHRRQALAPVTPEFFTHSPCRIETTRLAESAITLVRDNDEAIPLKAGGSMTIAHVALTSRPEEFSPEVFEATLAEAGHTVERFINPSGEAMVDEVATGRFDVVITSLFFPCQWGWGTVRCHGTAIRGIMSGYHLADPKVQPIFVSFDTPGHLYELAFMDPFLCTYGSCPSAQRALAEAILGRNPIGGRVPFTLEGFFTRGGGIRRP